MILLKKHEPLGNFLRVVWGAMPRTYLAINGWSLFIWGAFLVTPIKSFGTSTTFSVMEQIAPEYVWGSFTLLLGIVTFLSLDQSIKRRLLICILISLTWALVATSLIIANPLSTATPVYALIFFPFSILNLIQHVGLWTRKL